MGVGSEIGCGCLIFSCYHEIDFDRECYHEIDKDFDFELE